MIPVATDAAPVWAPQPGPQEAAIACPVGELFYGGARGGGKTDWLLGDFMVHRERHGGDAHGLLFRRALTEMQEIEKRAVPLYLKTGASYSQQRHEFKWPDGSTFRLAYLDTDSDADRYQGWQVTWLGVDEVGNFPSPEPIDKLRAILRSPAGVPCYLRLTGNPGGPGHHWVRDRYVRRSRPYEVFRYQPQPDMRPDLWVEAVFIPAKLEDNPLLMQHDPTYEQRLATVGGEALYKAWRYGDWDAIVGAVFKEWRSDLHVLTGSWEVPHGWALAGGMDWGYRAPGCFVLFASGPDQQVIAVDEVYFREQTAGDVGLVVGRLCRRYGHVPYIAADEQMTYRTGQTAPTLMEEFQQGIFRAFGDEGRWQAPAVVAAGHGRGSRLTKLQLMHDMLAWKAAQDGTVPPWGRPRLVFHERCHHCIRTIPALPHARDGAHGQVKEDVDTTAEDHAYDAVCAYLMSRIPKGEELQRERAGPDRFPGYDPKTQARRPRWYEAWERQHGLTPMDDEGLVPWRGDQL